MSVIPKYAVEPLDPYTDMIVTGSLSPEMSVLNTSSRIIAYSWKPVSVVTMSPTR